MSISAWGKLAFLHEDDRIEPIEREVLKVAALGNPHFACVNRLTRLFVKVLGDAVVVHVKNPVRIREAPSPSLT
jgi:hypothetical protein